MVRVCLGFICLMLVVGLRGVRAALSLSLWYLLYERMCVNLCAYIVGSRCVSSFLLHKNNLDVFVLGMCMHHANRDMRL